MRANNTCWSGHNVKFLFRHVCSSFYWSEHFTKRSASGSYLVSGGAVTIKLSIPGYVLICHLAVVTVSSLTTVHTRHVCVVSIANQVWTLWHKSGRRNGIYYLHNVTNCTEMWRLWKFVLWYIIALLFWSIDSKHPGHWTVRRYNKPMNDGLNIIFREEN